MDNLNDNILMKIFENLSLNDRSNVRLCNKKFKEQCDQIKIYKLVVTKWYPIYADFFKYTTEFYDSKDIVYVKDTENFFSNKILLNQMKSSIKYLYITFNEEKLCLNHKFNELIYLSLHLVYVERFDIFRSPKLEHLIFDTIDLEPIKKCNCDNLDDKSADVDELIDEVRKLINLSIPSVNTKLRIDNLTYLNHLKALNIKYKLFERVEYLNLFLDEFDIFIHIIRTKMFPNLKYFNCFLIFEIVKFLNDKQNVIKLVNKLEEDENKLKLYLFNIEYNKYTATFIVDLINKLHFNNKLKISGSNTALLIESNTDKFLNKFINNNQLNEFFKLFNQLIILDETLFNDELLKKLINIQSIIFYFKNYPKFEFGCKRYFKQFGHNIKEIKLEIDTDNYCRSNIRIFNDLLNQLSQYLNRIYSLTITSYEKINFDFLFQFKDRLRYLKLYLYYPIPFQYILKIVKDYKYLLILNIMHNRQPEFTNELLTKYKAKFNEYFKEFMNINYEKFKIQIIKRNQLQIIRYFYCRLFDVFNDEDLNDKIANDIFQIIDYKIDKH